VDGILIGGHKDRKKMKRMAFFKTQKPFVVKGFEVF